MSHVPFDHLQRYADNVTTDVETAVIEAHLAGCADCRSALGAVAPRVEDLWVAMAPALAIARRRPSPLVRAAAWASPAMVPWVLMTFAVAALAVVTDLLGTELPSLVLLLAPIAPVAGVAAAWSSGMDPAHEIVACTPRAGLYLVLRRTVAVLGVVLPVLLPLGWLVGASPARWLLPCLAFTATTLALGTLVGVRRAALGLVSVWVLLVVGPSLVTATVPALLSPAMAVLWLAAAAVASVLAVARASLFTRLTGDR
ncbi:zf-HC2 domain-containing protein [Actinokineospora auranticolor]|uniref:Putative zinc finger protein n=1 Tax=Actinokineospora auranticolor TaxID=155976 RepID=A0A2S6GF14_9PSEU|nr:zf-HC2 domain-containing protein [Actinokineospora auranticolor]PPK63828.1 putative zinc finger protein [Actinokineospora auranticolor]